MDLTTAQGTERARAGFTPSPTEPLKHQLLATLAQHRMAPTHQMHVLLRPDRSRQSVSERLNDLLGERLVDFVVLPQSHRTRVWHLTQKGARLTRDWPVLRDRPPYPITSATAASLKTPHTLTVLRTHWRSSNMPGAAATSMDTWTGPLRSSTRSATERRSWPTRSCTTRSSKANNDENYGRSSKSTAPP